MNGSHTSMTVCRLCLGHGEGMLPISLGQANYTKLILVFQLKLLKRVGVPSHICCVCLDRLDAAYQFKEQILNVGKTLQTLYGKVCVTTAKNKLLDSLSKQQVDLQIGGEVPVSFAEINTNGKNVPASMNLEASEIKNVETGNTEKNKELAIIEEVDPIAIDNEVSACLVNSKLEDCTTANDSGTSFMYVPTKTETNYVSIVDHIDPPSLEEETLEAKKQNEVDVAKKASKINRRKTKNCSCLLCGKTYWNVKKFTTHMQRQHGMNVDDLVKDNCGGSNVGIVYRCEFCKEAFSNNKKLKTHPCPAHTPRKPFSGYVNCSRCGKLFSVLKDLNEHISNSHMHKCNICDKKYNMESGLVNHMERIHKYEDRSKAIRNNEGEKNTQRKTKIMKKRNEEIIPITPQLHVVNPNSISSTVVESLVKINVEDLASGSCNQQHLQITDDLPLHDGHVLIKEEVDLGIETVETLTIPNFNDCQVNDQQFTHTSQTMAVNMGGNNTDMWQTVFPFKVEPFFHVSSFMEKEGTSEASRFDETQSMASTTQEENEKECCSCLICNISFQHFSQFLEHMTHHDDSNINRQPKLEKVPCHVCRKRFLDTKSYKLHLFRHRCPKAPVSVKQAALQARRAKEKAAQVTALVAAQVSAANRKCRLSKKMNAKWREVLQNSVKCTACKKTFTQTKELEIHLRKHRPKYLNDNIEECTCVYCDKGFLYKQQLAFHIKRCHFIPIDI